MKHILFAALLLLPGWSHAQYSEEAIASQNALIGQRKWVSPPLPMQGSRIVYEKSVSAPGFAKETLFNNALEWYNYNYKTPDTRLTVENPDKGTISGTGVIKYTPVAAGVAGEVPIFFQFDIKISDGQYAYKFYDMYGMDVSGRFEYADMYREDRNMTQDMKPRWDKKYRYEMLSDMNTMIEMSIVHLQQAMLMNSGVVNR